VATIAVHENGQSPDFARVLLSYGREVHAAHGGAVQNLPAICQRVRKLVFEEYPVADATLSVQGRPAHVCSFLLIAKGYRPAGGRSIVLPQGQSARQL
jgi:hypothetical protein